MNHYLWWIPLLVVACVFDAWTSTKVQAGGHWGWLVALFVVCAVPVWPAVAFTSKRLLFDALVFDSVGVVVYAFALVALGAGSLFSTVQWFGLGIVVIGLIMMKVS